MEDVTSQTASPPGFPAGRFFRVYQRHGIVKKIVGKILSKKRNTLDYAFVVCIL